MFNLNRLAVNQSTPLVESSLSLSEAYTDTDRHNHSYLMEALDFCKSIDNEMLENNRVFYGALCESEGNDTLINEGFSEWMSTFKKIIKKVLDFLKALLNKFLVGINMLIKREKFLKDHKKDFNKFNENHKFHMNIYKFTFEPNVPDEKAIYNSLSKEGKLTLRATSGAISQTYNDIQSNYYEDDTTSSPTVKGGGSIKVFTDVKDIDDAYDAYIRALSDGDYYDKVRAYMLGGKAGERIDASDYSKELFDIFRDGGSKEDKEFELQDINETWIRFESYDKIKKDLEKKKKEAEKEYNAIAKELDKAVEVIKNPATGSSALKIKGKEISGVADENIARKYEYYMKARANEVNEVASIHTIAFSARLDAYKDCFNQDKTILYKALYRILGNIRTGVREESANIGMSILRDVLQEETVSKGLILDVVSEYKLDTDEVLELINAERPDIMTEGFKDKVKRVAVAGAMMAGAMGITGYAAHHVDQHIHDTVHHRPAYTQTVKQHNDDHHQIEKKNEEDTKSNAVAVGTAAGSAIGAAIRRKKKD